MSRHFYKTLIETQIVSDGILPALLVLPVKRKVPRDELVDSVKRQSLLGALSDCHHDQRVVAERWLVELGRVARVFSGVCGVLRGTRLFRRLLWTRRVGFAFVVSGWKQQSRDTEGTQLLQRR